MARIRSIHPGVMTDEQHVSVSRDARLFAIYLWTECDDKGVFEWKPLQLKIRIFPADDVDVQSLLEELEQANIIKSYEIDGRKYAAFRNFRKFQRPKTPNDIHPMPDDFRKYVGIEKPSSDKIGTVSESFPQKGEKSPQMEDGGGKREEKEEDIGGASAPTEYAFVGKVVRLTSSDYAQWQKTYHAVRDLNAELTAADAYYAENPPKDGKWFFPVSNWLKRAHGEVMQAREEEERAKRTWN